MRTWFFFPMMLTLGFIASRPAIADSPLTEPDFSTAYEDVDPVLVARGQGVLDPRLALVLSDPGVAIDVKAALVNGLGWDIDGKRNGELYVEFLAAKYSVSADTIRNPKTERLTADEQFSLGYLLAMDDYFHPERGLPYLEAAKKLRPQSYTVALVTALVRAQLAMDRSWCRVWKEVEKVERNAKRGRLEPDFRASAHDIVFEYMTLYEC